VPPDTLSVVLRSASFIALFQAAGMTLFIALFGRQIDASRDSMRRITIFSAIAAIVLLIGQYLLEAARMADDISGMLDPSLQMMALHSALSAVLALRVLGLGVIIAASRRGGERVTFGVLGTAAVLISFVFIGHTAANPLHWLLAALLIFHVAIVAFWFGALLPLYLVSHRESPAVAAGITNAFSSIAGWLVPGIMAAGLLLGIVLVRHLSELRLPYGILLLSKVGGFAFLMGLAALNKWRLGPAVASGDGLALRAFRRSLVIEYILIAAVLTVTAAMTTLYSPEP